MITAQDFIAYLTNWEGDKRIESFFSEYFFTQQLRDYYTPSNTAIGWFRYNIGNTLYFIRFYGSHSAKHCMTMADRQFSIRAIEAGCRVYLANYDAENDSYMACRIHYDSNHDVLTHTEYGSAADTFLAASGKRALRNARPAENQNTNTTETEKKLLQLYRALGKDEAFQLYLARRFIYDVLYPCFHWQPTDIDAITCIDNRLTIYEFKRKRPANSYYLYKDTHNDNADFFQLEKLCNNFAQTQKISTLTNKSEQRSRLHQYLTNLDDITHHNRPSYGIDRGHTLLIRWCSGQGIDYQLVHWHRETRNSMDFINTDLWIMKNHETFNTCTLNRHNLKGFNFTYGKDSGMNKRFRTQETVPTDIFKAGEMKNTVSLKEIFDYIEAPRPDHPLPR